MYMYVIVCGHYVLCYHIDANVSTSITPTTPSNGSKRLGTIIGIVFGILILIVIGIVIVIYCYRKKVHIL